MERKERKRGAVALTAEAGGHHSANFDKRLRGERDEPVSMVPMIEISDADYRSLLLPCDALEDKNDCKPGR